MSLRPFLFLPSFTNVLEDAFSDLHFDHPALPHQYRGEELPTASSCSLLPGDLLPDIYSGSPSLELAQSLTFMCFLLGMIGSQVYPYRSVSTPNQRRQTKWVVVGTTLALSELLAVVAPLFLFAPGVGLVIYILFGRGRKAFSRASKLLRQELEPEAHPLLTPLLSRQDAEITRLEGELGSLDFPTNGERPDKGVSSP